MKPRTSFGFKTSHRTGFTLIELLVVIAIIAILAVVVVLTLNPAQLLAQSRDANRVSDMATLQSALNLYVTDQAGVSTFTLGSTASTGISIYDPNGSSTCGSLGLPSLSSSTWYCGTSTSSRSINGYGWIPVNLSLISAGAPIGSLPADPINQTTTGLFYAYNTNGSQFEVTTHFESSKYKSTYGSNSQTTYFPEVVSGGIPGLSALYNPTGLVAYWPMDEGSGSSTIDASGNGNIGSWVGASAGTNNTHYTSGKVGSYAGYFDGSTNYVSITSSSFQGSLTSFTTASWVYVSSLNGTGAAQYDIYYNLNGSLGLYPRSSISGNGSVQLQLKTGGLTQTLTTSSSLMTAGSWEYLTETFNGANNAAVIYLNGNAVATTTFTAGSLNSGSGSAVNLGYDSNQSLYLSGALDDFRVYNRSLSAAEAMALYNAEK